MTGAHKLPSLSETQWEIMNLIWDQAPRSVGEVWQVLKKRRGVSRNTVQTQMVRLEEKGWLTHQEDDAGFRYFPTVSREESQENSVKRFVKTVFGGSSEGLLLALLSGGELSQEEAARIRAIINSQGKKK
ncbi:BlaI/MecI/CopY family transcriptional regulator [Bremerella sp. JC770]|uniref:BlaI/MecI/CopY family transcriptional regulator n=1 Tax=Bremerella sp. JC770 TaxID=3232137 RepID=UPI00345A7FEA